MNARWTPWRPLETSAALDAASLAETLDGGQAFRWRQQADSNGGTYWTGIWSDHAVRLRLDAAGQPEASHPTRQPDAPAATRHYLGLDSDLDWNGLSDSLPWRSDAHLATCISAFPNLRLLRQPFEETLLCFLCSATKQIPQIKVMCENLANAFGASLHSGVHALPTWPELAVASESELRALGLGFRAKNIKGCADRIASDPTMLNTIARLPYEDAKLALMQLPGVGEKIADCALLFGAGMLQAFPVDTWILKTLASRYGLVGWTPSQLAQFGRAHFGPNAGYAQQFLFAYERKLARSAADSRPRGKSVTP